MDGLALLAVNRRPVGRRGRRLGRGARACARSNTSDVTIHGVALLSPAAAGDLLPGTPRGADADPVEPVAQQVRVANGVGLSGQDEENSLKGVFGMLHVAEELSAHA
jgi:hypothetical protein